MFISVIIPNYNHSSYLQDRIESVLNQTYQNFEIILLDDSSSDDSRDILELYRFNNKVSNIIYNNNNSGSTFKQWKKGFYLAKGDFIWIAESDDYADPFFLEKVMNSISENKSSLCFSMSKIIDKTNTIMSTKSEILETPSIDYRDFVINNLLYDNSIYNASMVVFKKDIVPDHVWDDISKLKYCGDWLFWAEIIINSKGIISEVKEPLNNFRIHNLNVSGKAESKGLTFIEGFPISLKIMNLLKIKKTRDFATKWFLKWLNYRDHYSFSKSTNLKILKMFFFKRPYIVLLEFKRLFISNS